MQLKVSIRFPHVVGCIALWSTTLDVSYSDNGSTKYWGDELKRDARQSIITMRQEADRLERLLGEG